MEREGRKAGILTGTEVRLKIPREGGKQKRRTLICEVVGCLLGTPYFTSDGGERRGNSVTGRPVYLLRTRVVPFSGNIGISF